MNYNIDTLLYEAKGADGGGVFTTQYKPIKKITLHRMRDQVPRNDGITVTYVDGTTSSFGSVHYTVKMDFEIKEGQKFNVFQGYLTTTIDKKMDNEPCYGGLYGMFFYNKGTNDLYDKAIDAYRKDGFSVAECVIPDDFKLVGLHGRQGARLDRVGIIIEKQY